MIRQGSRKKLLCLHAMRPGKRILVVLLVLHWSARGSAATDGSAETHPQCDTDGSTVRCTLEETHLMSPDPIKLDFTEGQTVEIYSACQQNGSDGLKCLCQRINTSMHALQQTERFGNETYTVICGNHSVTVVRSPQRRPSVPVLKAIAKAGSTNIAQLVCTSEGNPKPTIRWYGNRNNPEEGMKNKWYKTESIVTSDDDHHESPNITCCASNSLGKECTQLHHFDLDRKVDGQKAQTIFLTSGQSLLLRCAIKSMDAPELRWHFNNTAVKGITSLYFTDWTEYFFIESVNVTHSGEYICVSKNKQTRNTYVRVLENDKIDILQVNENNSILARNKASFCFQALVFSYPKAQCHWITPNQTKIQCKETHYHNFNSTFKLCNPEPGQYQMKLKNQYYSVIRSMSLCISDDPKIAIKLHNDSNVISCETESSLPMTVSWKICPSHTNCNNEGWKEIPVAQPKVMDSDQFCQKKIYFARPRSNSEDHFMKCCISNIAGTECSDQIRLPTIFLSIDYVICFLVIFILLAIIFALIIFIRVKKPGYQCQIQMIQMIGPNDNDYIYIDFREFKYDLKWEFPRENLELGNELGSGAFGMVVQATAYGISKPGVSIQVAVKMLKDKHQAVEKEALMSELKMLTHIGHHENIVNLLGACTGSGPIYLVFQYCCNGDLLNYLKSNRERFHKYLTDAFNRDRFRGLYHNFQQKRNSSEYIEPDNNQYVHMTPSTKGQENEALLSPSISSVSTIEEMLECEDKHQEEVLQSLTYDDLLSFSFQVAKGMEFLSSKNCIHRDLAARNVLVTHGRQVKIGDFGLARDIEHDSNYVVRGNVRLPVKWMAPESIFQGVYTMQSDVWAYGILLWEIFSLGVTPYPGITVNDAFYRMIESGYHMEQPYYAEEFVYKVMCRCWMLDPVDRPCFSKLVAFMEKELAALEERLYYNVGGYCHNDITYQNAPVTPDATLMEKMDVCQSDTENSDESKAVDNPGSVRTEPLV
ncbi:receptor-type tyrosine-protein kinase FLT3-like [Sinocyclocheilus rhinocerous]|uniref:receptor-type tyrosine-protein kinase FLT3-like n=1 Tax=Sinocyclocheilus rhinocerous TaxID=307959 RepID=UPI0007BABB88|nr:PREDICTED: receptor-type tyrosine-protein kinase FLT3-like [Sinocyclocheilus rhinocerous]